MLEEFYIIAESACSKNELTESLLTAFQQNDELTLVIMDTMATLLHTFYPRFPNALDKKKDQSVVDVQQRLVDIVR